jgi:ATP-binding cassette subfamily B protein
MREAAEGRRTDEVAELATGVETNGRFALLCENSIEIERASALARALRAAGLLEPRPYSLTELEERWRPLLDTGTGCGLSEEETLRAVSEAPDLGELDAVNDEELSLAIADASGALSTSAPPEKSKSVSAAPGGFRLRAQPRLDTGIVQQAPPVPVGELFRRFWPYTRSFRPLLGLTFVLIALVPASDTALIWMFKLLIDRVLVPRDFDLFPVIAGAYLGLTLLGGVVSFFDGYLSSWIGERFLIAMRGDFFRHLHGLSLDFLDRRRLGDLVSRLTSDISAIEDFVVSGVGDAVAYATRILFFGAALFFLSWELALAALVVAPLFLVVSRVFTHRIKDASREKRSRSGSISAVAEESLANAMLVQAYGQEDFEAERFQRESLGSFEAALRSARLRSVFRPLVKLLESGGVLLVAGFGTWELSRGRLTIGGLLVFITYLSQLYSPIRRLGALGNGLFAASAAAERVLEFLDERPSIGENPGGRALHRARGVVTFEGVSFRYPDSRGDALSNVSFEVEPGETIALVGPSGAGKSTVAKLLLRFYDPKAGRILLDGHNLPDLSLRSLRANIAVVLQETFVFDGTIRENIAYGRRRASDHEVIAAASAADAHEFIMSLPNGYETVVGQKGRLLSGGQRQRIAIARAMIRNAPVLVLDEPTTGLDAESAERILAPLRRLMSGRATIVISHNLLNVHEANTIVVLEEGRVTGRDSHWALIENNTTYERLYGLHRGQVTLR